MTLATPRALWHVAVARAVPPLALLAAAIAPRLAAAQVFAIVEGTNLIVQGNADANTIAVTCVDGFVRVNGQHPSTGPFPCGNLTRIDVEAGGGDDTIDLSAVTEENGFEPESFFTVLRGEAGADTIIGSAFSDQIIGGPENDVIDERGGDGLISWIPGDGNDFVDGAGGTNTLEVTGSEAREGFHLFPGYFGTPARLDVVHYLPACCTGPSAVDVQRVVVDAGGGDDDVILEDLFDTVPYLTEAEVRMLPGSADWVTFNGKEGSDLLSVETLGPALRIFEGQVPPWAIRVYDADRLFTFGRGGSDLIRTQGLPGTIQHQDGGAQELGDGDSLVVDTEGLPSTHVGSVIRVEGRQPINYTGFEGVVVEKVTAVDEGPGGAPARLGAPYPNPLRDGAAFTLSLPRPQRVRVALYDALGRAVAVLHDGPLPAGERAFALAGRGLAPGVYLLRATGEALAATRRVTVAR